MYCSINFNIDEYPNLKKLNDVVGNREIMKYINIIGVMNEDGIIVPSSDFINYAKSQNVDIEIDFAKDNMQLSIKELALEYYKTKYLDATDFAKDDKISSVVYGYLNIASRNEIKEGLVSLLILQQSTLKRGNKNILEESYLLNAFHIAVTRIKESSKPNKKDLIKSLSILVKNSISSKQFNTGVKQIKRFLSDNKINNKINETKFSKEYYKHILKNKIKKVVIDKYKEIHGTDITITPDNINSLIEENKDFVQLRNLLSLYNEVIINSKNYDNFFEELLHNSKITFIKNNKQVDDLSLSDNLEDEEFDEEELTKDLDNNEVTVDLSIKSFDHSGNSHNFITHVEEDIISYFNSLFIVENYNNNGTFVIKNGELSGLPLTMNATEVSRLLYHYTDKTDMPSFIKSIERLSTHTQYISLRQIAEDMKTNIHDGGSFANKIFRIFSKQVVTKVQGEITDGDYNVKISNPNSNPLHSFRNNLFNSFRSHVITLDKSKIEEELNKPILNKVNNSNLNENKVVEALGKIFEYYFGKSISQNEILHYISNHKENGILDKAFNINNLKSKLSLIANEINEIQKHKSTRLKNNEDILTKEVQQSLIDLSNLLKDHCIISCEINSINTEGNQSSDVMNNSYITAIKTILKNPNILENYGKFKLLASYQYKLSNILLEHRDKDDNIINYGLFRYTGNVLEITEYAEDLLDIYLYDGIRNNDLGKGSTYAKHSKPDYLGSMFMQFFNNEINKNPRIQTAGYFMRTPSDAPRNWVVNAPKYDIDGLFKDNSKELVNAELNNKIDQIRIIGEQKTIVHTIYDKEFYLKSIVDGKIKFKLTNKERKLKDTDETIIGIQLLDDNVTYESSIDEFTLTETTRTRNNNVIYYVKGSIKDGYFEGVIEGVNKENDKRKDFVPVILNNLENENKIKRSVNKNHPMYIRIRNMFNQELLDRHNGLSFLFNLDDNGNVLRYSEGILQWKDQNIEIDDDGFIDGSKLKGAVYNYHFRYNKEKNKGIIVERDKNGNLRLTGNVFHSDRFILYDKDNNAVRNYGEEILNAVEESGKPVFNPLYGGGVKINDNQELELTDVQISHIDNILEQYILDLCKDAYNRLANVKEIIKSEHYNFKDIATLMLNYQVAYGMFNDLFEGDSKVYKDPQDFLKRAKEVQGAGVPYGFIDFLNLYNSTIVKPKKQLEIDYNKDGKKATYILDIKSTFKAITIKNTITNNEESKKVIIDQLTKTFLKQFKKTLTGTDSELENLARSKAKALMSGYSGTTANDAQSYITFDEWVRRIVGRGQYAQYKSLISKILSGKELTGEDINEFIQVQKNFYYDIDYNKDANIHTGRQIKNAEFVLVPQLIEGTELQAVYELMKHYGIDQLNTEETSKAGKYNVLSIFNEKTGEVHKDIIDEINSGFKIKSEFSEQLSYYYPAYNEGEIGETYRYEFLYTQQETPQHLADKNKAGIQIMKKIIDNITKDHPQLWDAKNTFIDCYCENIKDSAKTLFLELFGGNKDSLGNNGNIKITENADGSLTIYGLDYNVFYDKFKQELYRLNVNSNILDYATLEENTKGITIMPSFLTILGKKLENVSQSIFNNNITRQKLPGFHAAQITNIGFRKLADSKKNVSYSKELKYHRDDDGNYVDYIEIMLPKSAFNFNLYDKDGNLKDDDTLLNELKDAKLDNVIGYRIPTEGKQSVCKMKVVGFIPDGYGSTIVVPNEWVAQTGSDFDIDSVYGIQHATYINDEGKIAKYEADDDTPINKLSRDKRTNKLIDSMLYILSHTDSLEECVSRSNFDDITEARNKVLSKDNSSNNRRKSRSCFNAIDQAEYQEDAMSGAKLKGFSVTRDNFCSICNTIRPKLSSTNFIKLSYNVDELAKSNQCKNEDGSVNIDNLMNILKTRFGEKNVKLNDNTNEIIITHTTFGWTGDNKNVLGKILTIYSSQTTAHILDAIKEGFIPNVNDYTFGVYKLFPDIGSDYENAIRFITSDGVTRIVNNYNKSKSIFLNEYINPIEQSIKDIAIELGINVDYSDTIETILDKINEVSVTSHPNNLSIDDVQKLLSELDTILKFKEYKSLADNITSLATVCNPDKFGAKQTIYQTNKVFNDIDKILKNPPTLYVNNGNILSSIYPSIENGIVKYITSDYDKSSYKILHTFLKYATAPSIIINRHLFETKSLNFLNFIDEFAKYLNRNKGLTETQVNAFERYVIGELYHKSKLTLPITYINEAIENPFVTLLDENTNEDEIRIKEIERILGLNYTPDINMNVKDLSNPTQEEINSFAKLTPAQKIMYLKDHVDNIELFDVLQVNLYNIKKFNKKQAGRQTISYIENTTNIEDIYRMFNDVFNSKHPFMTLAAYDLIKYAFIAENYTMTKTGISKIIPNSVLKGHPSLNNEGECGIELVDELRKLFNDFEDSIFANNHIYDNFVRSNHEILNIPTRTVVNNELYTRNNGMIIIPHDEGDLLDKYKIREKQLIDEDVYYTANRFIKLKINGTVTLYKINTVNDGYVLYPLQYLDTNEHTEYSINTKNNLLNRYRESQYKMLIDALNDYDQGPNGYDEIEVTDKNGNQLSLDKIMSNVLTYTSKTKEFIELNNKETKKLAKSDIKIIDANTSIFKSITDELAKQWKAFTSNDDNVINEHHMYFLHQGLNNVLYVGEKARVTNLTITKGTGENYIEYSPNLEIYKLSIPALKAIQKQLNGSKISDRYKALIHHLQGPDMNIKNIIDIDKEGNVKVLLNIYGVKEIKNNTTVRRSSIEEGSVNTEEVADNGSLVSLNVVAGDILNTIMHTNSKTLEDTDINKILSNIEKLFNAGDPLTVDINEILSNGANYITKRVDSIKHRLQYFITDDSNSDKRYTILSNEAMKAIYEDPDKRNDYLRVLLEAKQILKKNEDIFKLIIEGNDNIDDNQKYYLNIIKNKLNELSKEQSIFNKAWDLFFNEYLKQYTTNPLIKNDTLIVLNGFYSTSSFNTWIGDMQESTNPAIQIITKEVVKDLFAKSKMAEKLKRKFLSKIADLEEQARREGLSINYSNIIDEYGRFVDNFKKEFIEDKEKLETAIIESEAEWRKEQDSYLKDLAFRKYYDSIRKFNKWKLENVEQPIVDDYYKKIIALEDNIISKHPQIFYKYKQLQKLRGELYNKCSSDGTLDPAIEKQIDEIDNKLSQLKDPFIYVNGQLEQKIEYDGFNTPKGSEKDIYNAHMMSYQSGIAINNYEIEYNSIKNEYFQKVEKEQFRNLLNTYLNTIAEYEKVNAEGYPIYAKTYLETQLDYVTAKKWIKENARYALSEEMQEKLQEAFSKLEKGFASQVLKDIVKSHKCKDEYGVIDARVFTDSEIKAIKDAQLAAKMYTESQSYSDTNLMKMSSPTVAVYTNDFYEGLVLKGIKNREWQNIVNEINDILKVYYDPITKSINFDEIPNNKEGIAVYKKLGELYSILQNTKKKEDVDKAEYKKVQKFIKENVDTELSKAEKDMFDIAEEKARNKGDMYHKAWCLANYLVVTDHDTGISRRIPNYYLWGSLKPKADKIDKFTNKHTKEKEEAIKLIDATYEVVSTEYYKEKEREIREKSSKEEYRKWYYENHIYNNRTKQFEPIKCWTTMKVKDDAGNVGRWYPRWHNTETTPIISAENPAYKKDVGYAPNYKITGKYTVQNNKNKYEEEISQLFKQVLYDLTKNKKDIKYLDKGYMPAIDKNDKSVGKTIVDELLKTLGLKVSATGENVYHDKLGFEINEEISTPLLSRLNQVTPAIRGIVKPIKEDDETDEEFNKRLNEYNKELEVLSKENDEAHKNAINNNWKEVMATFIIQASRINAIRDNELILYAAQHMLETEEILDPKHIGRKTEHEFKVNWNESNKHKTVYSKKDQHELLNQWETWMRRVLYDEFKEPNGKLTRWAARFQSITSSQYMMMNFRGGIANVTLGGVQILMERLARDYFDSKDYFKALGYFDASILDQLLHMDSDKASTLAGAIIKFMSVVDYNEHKGISVIAENTTMKGFKHFNRIAYSPQTMGENYLQNTVLFAILESNRVFKETDKYGNAKLVFKNEKEYIRDRELDLIERYINQISDNTLKEQYRNEYNQIKEDIKKDINLLAKYAWFKKDLISDFAYKVLQINEAQKQFAEYRSDIRKQAKEEFRNHPTVMSELELSEDGYLDFKPDSTLAQFDISENGKPSESLLAISGLKGKVISVNKKIHGVYDKLGQAQIEKKWWGSLAMQYHKHIWPGILKRWRIKGYYNEERGSIERGSMWSLLSFISTPINKMTRNSDISQESKNALKGLQNVFKNILSFSLHIKTHYRLLPDYEKANICRSLAESIGILTAALLTLVVRAIGDEDDEENSIIYNLAIYELDRLASEASIFYVTGAYSEFKKLWSKPIAAQSLAEDAINVMGFITNWLFDENYNPVYQTGRFAGENKIISRLKRRIPFYRGIHTGLFDIVENNRYYKVGENILNSRLIEEAIEWIEDEE